MHERVDNERECVADAPGHPPSKEQLASAARNAEQQFGAREPRGLGDSSGDACTPVARSGRWSTMSGSSSRSEPERPRRPTLGTCWLRTGRGSGSQKGMSSSPKSSPGALEVSW